MKVVTWSRESHGLFDYESKNIDVKKCKVDNPCKIYRSNESEVELVDYHSKNIIKDENSSYLTSIIAPNQLYKDNLKFMMEQQKQQFFLSPQELPSQDSNYLIVRSLKNKQGQQKGYSLRAGDILKLGRIEYLVVQTKNDISTETVEELHMSELHNPFVVNKNEYQMEEQKQCKICLGESSGDDDFFLSPCKCKGSCEYVHFQCLKMWVDSKVSKKQVGATFSYNWNKSECEICKTPLPKKVLKDNKEFDIVEVEKPEGPYLILQSLAQDKKVSKNLFVIYGIPDEVVSLGRGHNCEVRISDISVSRTHSFIKYVNNEFMITDNNSKFGTLIKLKSPIPLSNDKVAVQVGRTVITFVIKNDQQNSSNKENNTQYYTLK